MNEDIKTPTIPSISVGAAVDTLSRLYTRAITCGTPLKTLPSVMLWGPPGVGKSQGVRELASRIEGTCGKRVNVTDVRLLLFNPIDLRGIPTANEDRTLAIWLRPKIFDMDPSEDVVNILFLDEISAAPQSVQAAAYQITLDRVVGEHRLPDNCIVIAAGNRVTDKSVAFKMPKALANRLLHLEIEPSFDSWKQWAVTARIDARVVGFLDSRRDFLMRFNASADDLAFATPRTWEMVSRVLDATDPDGASGTMADETFRLVAGLIGMGPAVEFRTWATVFRDLPRMEDIFSGRSASVPRGSDALFALTSSMTAYAREHRSDTGALSNSLTYASSLPPDFAVVLMKDYLYLGAGMKERLMGLPEWRRLSSRYGGVLNGSV